MSLLSNTKRRLLSLSIHRKLLFAAVASTTGTLSLFAFAYLVHERNAFYESKFEQLKSISQILASNSQAALIFGDAVTANEYLQSLKAETDIRGAVLFDSTNSQFATFQRGDIGYILAKMPSEKEGVQLAANSATLTTRIFLNEEAIGTLLIELDTTSLNQKLREATLKALGVIAIGTMISVLVAKAVQFLIGRPILELQVLATKVAQNGDYSHRAYPRYDDEIGSLARGVNSLMQSVQDRDDEITEHNRDLENKISERTAELSIALKQANAASIAKTEFLSTMSHELRTPLNAIIGMSSIVSNGELPREIREHVEIIQASSDTLLSLINQILDYSKIESGHLEVESHPLDLTRIVEESTGIIAALHWEKPIDFFTTIDPSLPASILGDQTRLRQILVNLLGNAAKFTKTGHVWIEVCHGKNGQDSPHLQISVHDTGIGIPVERQNRLFQTFSQVDSSTTRQFGGTGLGLAITKKLALAMGGDVTVASSAGQGSTFSLSIPMESESTKSIAQATQPSFSSPNTSIQISIPFEPLQKSLCQLFTDWGIELKKPDEEADFAIGSRFKSISSTTQPKAKKSTLFLAHPLVVQANSNETAIISALPPRIEELKAFIQKASKSSNVKKESPKTLRLNSMPPPGTRILLAEDNKVNQRVFRIIMKREGYKIDIANNGLEAVAAMCKIPYHIIFMDLQMPEMDGLEACREIRSNNQLAQPWIIGFTANVESEAEPAMRAAGMDDYISKPVKDERVRQALSDYLQATNTTS